MAIKLSANKAMKTIVLAVSVSALAIGTNGCGGGVAEILGAIINLAGGAAAPAGALGAGGNQGVGAPETTPGIGQAAPAPAPLGNQQRPGTQTTPLPATAQEQRNELTTKYGITLRGSVTENDCAQALTFARAYPPAATRGLSFTYTADRKQQGVLGVWQNSGQSGVSEIYSDLLDVVFHEGTHQVTLANQNEGTTGTIGRNTVAAAKQAGGGTIPSNCITRSYARTNDEEFMAEFFTGLRSLENGLQTRFTLGGGTFNPPENVRAIGRQIYAQQ